MSTENYKYRGRESKKMCTANKTKKEAFDLKVLEVMEEANKAIM
jgi:hypothetical protein